MSEPTLARRQGEFLLALAGHLIGHPDLEPVFVTTDSTAVHVSTGRAAGPLLAWFASVGAGDLRVELYDDYATVHARPVVLGGHRVRVWGAVDGLQRVLVQGGPGRLDGGLRLTVAELAHFADHGVLPERGTDR